LARRNDHTKEELKQLIFEAALSIVNEQGWEELSARKIAKKIGYTAPSIYIFYKNVDELILHINSVTLESLSKKIQKALGKTCNLAEQIYAIGNAYLHFSSSNPNLWELLFEYRYTAINIEKLPQWYQDKVDEIFSIPMKIFKQIMRNETEIKLKTQLLWAGLHGIATLDHRGKLLSTKSAPSHKLLEQFIEIFVSALRV
jgi:AcrR family transcriptional regulator